MTDKSAIYRQLETRWARGEPTVTDTEWEIAAGTVILASGG